MMAYLNPISLLELTDPEPPSYGTLRARHKRFLSELELDQLEFFEWGDQTFSRQDLAEAVAACQDTAILTANYLAATQWGLNPHFISASWLYDYPEADVFTDPRLRPLLETKFVAAYARQMASAYTVLDLEEVEYLLALIPPTLIEMDTKLYGELYDVYTSRIALLRAQLYSLLEAGPQVDNHQPYLDALETVHLYFNANLVSRLPAYFATANNKLARLIAEVMIPLFDTHNSYRLCKALARTGLALPHLTQANQDALVRLSPYAVKAAEASRRPPRVPVYSEPPVNAWVESLMVVVVVLILGAAMLLCIEAALG